MAILEKIIEEIKENTWGNSYYNYIKLYQKGLKKEAKSALKVFINELKILDKLSRRNFVDIVYRAAFYTEDYSVFLPVNLYNEIILPEIKDWISEEPNNPIPNRWSKDVIHNKRALELDPHDQIAIINFVNRIIGMVSMNQHEIAAGFSYDGNPNEDISLINFSEKFLTNIQNIEKKNRIHSTLKDLKSTALLFIK